MAISQVNWPHTSNPYAYKYGSNVLRSGPYKARWTSEDKWLYQKRSYIDNMNKYTHYWKCMATLHFPSDTLEQT